MSPTIEVAALSDMGCVRTNNEDNFGYDPVHQLYVVCDGMGGMAAGEVASAIACRTVIETFAAQPEETAVDVRLFLAIRSANDAVWAAGQTTEHQGMGTTLVSLVITDDKLLVGNVGDSRAYRIKGEKCIQITKDHSYINELIRMGAVSENDRHTVDLKGMETVITRAIGAGAAVEPDFFGGNLTPGDIILLASDGLTRYIDAPEIYDLVRGDDLDGSCRRLIETAKSMGGADNITVVLVRYVGASTGAADTAEAPLAAAETEMPPVPASAGPEPEPEALLAHQAEIDGQPPAAQPISETASEEPPASEETPAGQSSTGAETNANTEDADDDAVTEEAEDDATLGKLI